MRGSKKIICTMLLLLVTTNFVWVGTSKVSSIQETNFTLTAMVSEGTGIDVLNLVKQQLALLGIQLEIEVLSWPEMINQLINLHEYDLTLTYSTGGSNSPDMSGYFSENSSLNFVGYSTELDYDSNKGTGINEWYLQHGQEIFPADSPERIQHYWDWQQYLMDRICPGLPFLIPKNYEVYHNGLYGYNISKGIIQSWGDLNWISVPDGKENGDELVVTEYYDCLDLNPLFLTDCGGDAGKALINTAVLDKLIWLENDFSYQPHIISQIEYISDTDIRLHLRDNITWADDPEGIFASENVTVTAKDLYFTFYCYNLVQSMTGGISWLEDFEIIDNMTLGLTVDANPITPENEPSMDFLEDISQFYILPEHYLNQTQLADGTSPNITTTAWDYFNDEPFGTGLFEIDSLNSDEVILSVKDKSKCWWRNSNITKASELNWNKRFGDTENPALNQLRIRNSFSYADKDYEFQAKKLDLISTGEINEYDDSSNYIIKSKIGSYFNFIGYNLESDHEHIADRSPCPSDPSLSVGLAVRKAISYAINLNEINSILHANKRAINYHPTFANLGIWLNPDIIKYEHDLQKAKELMVKAGYVIENYTPEIAINGFSTIFTVTLISIYILIRRRKRN